MGNYKTMATENNESKVALIKAEINRQLGDTETMKSLLDTTFKGLDAPTMKRALLEGMIRGFPFESFLNRDVYAIPYGTTYSLVTSIDYSRKIGAKSGIVGVEAPKYTYEDGKIVRCSMTVKKRFPDGYIGEFTAEPSFREYSTGKNLWSSKPETMISKVAEMHALRKACPEELAQAYVEEEFQREAPKHVEAIDVEELAARKIEVHSWKTMEDMERGWADMPGQFKVALKDDMEEVKAIIMSASKDIT